MSPDLQDISSALAAREARVRDVLRRALDADAAVTTEPQDFKDLAVSENEAEIDQGVSDLAAAELALIADARRRLADGTYGACADCGEPIDPARLLALPTALRCVACQQEQEHGAHARA